MVRSRFTFPETDIVTPYWYTPTSPNAEITNTRSSLNTYPGVHKSSRLDYCNLGLLLYGVSDNLIRRVQSAQNAAARLLTGAGRRDHISPVLRQLHWLPVHRVQRRVDYKLYVLSSRLCLASHLHTSPSTYIWSPKVIDGGYALPPTDRVPFHAHNTRSATGASLSPGHVFGTVFQPTCATRTLQTVVSGVNSNRFVLMLLPGHNETFVNCAI